MLFFLLFVLYHLVDPGVRQMEVKLMDERRLFSSAVAVSGVNVGQVRRGALLRGGGVAVPKELEGEVRLVGLERCESVLV